MTYNVRKLGEIVTSNMEPYMAYLLALAFLNIALGYHRYHAHKQDTPDESLALPSSENNSAASKFRREYFSLYTLVMAADWLQGPYMYTLYKDEKGLAEATVALLFTTGFVTAGVSASFVGSLADSYGRKAACLSYCVVYSLSYLSVISNDLSVLLAGRALGGLSTTLQYSVFETWMISEYHKRDLKSCLSLGSMFSWSVTLSGIVAIVSGMVGEAVVERTGTKTSPFMAAFICLAAAFIGIHQLWGENYGKSAGERRSSEGASQATLFDPRLLALGLTTTVFEGSMYLFVFFWSPALISSRRLAGNTDPPPFGIIFSCFMCAMMLGSLVFSVVIPGAARDAGKLMLTIMALASYALLIPVLHRAEVLTFWSFALFEVCVGLYFPTMSRLKAELVEDAVRAKAYGLMRMPLNVFVVVALGITKDGDDHRSRVFTVVGALLLSSFWVVQRYLA